MQTLKAPERLISFSNIPYKFIVFGCGGTGSYFVRDLFRLVSVYNVQFNRRDEIVLMDQDVVKL